MENNCTPPVYSWTLQNTWQQKNLTRWKMCHPKPIEKETIRGGNKEAIINLVINTVSNAIKTSQKA